MEHGLKDTAFYAQKHTNTLQSCHNFPAGPRQAARGTGICETNLLHRSNCPASRTTLVATRFRVAVICPIIQVPHCIRVFFYFV